MSVAGTVLAIGFNAMFADILPPDWETSRSRAKEHPVGDCIMVGTLVSGQILDRVEFSRKLSDRNF